MAKKAEKKTLRVTLIHSWIGYPAPQERTLKALGLRHLHQTVEHADTPALRGMLNKVIHLIQVEE